MSKCKEWPFNVPDADMSARCKLTNVLIHPLTIEQYCEYQTYYTVIRHARVERLPLALECKVIDKKKFDELNKKLETLETALPKDTEGKNRWTFRRILNEDSKDWPKGVKAASWDLRADVFLAHNHVPDRTGRPYEPKYDINRFFHPNVIDALGVIGCRNIESFLKPGRARSSTHQISVWWLGKRFGVFEQYWEGPTHLEEAHVTYLDVLKAKGEYDPDMFRAMGVNNRCYYWDTQTSTWKCFSPSVGNNCTSISQGPGDDDDPC